MESIRENSCSVIQYYKGPNTTTNNAETALPNSIQAEKYVKKDTSQTVLPVSSNCKEHFKTELEPNHNDYKGETSVEMVRNCKSEKREDESSINYDQFELLKDSTKDLETNSKTINNMGKISNEKDEVQTDASSERNVKMKFDEAKTINDWTKDVNLIKDENQPSETVKKRKLSQTEQYSEFIDTSNVSAEEGEGNEDGLESDFDNEEGEDIGNKPRRRGRSKKNPDIIPSHLSSDMVLGYKILLKFLEIPQFLGFHKPLRKSKESEDCKITSLNQIKKKFEENSYTRISEFVNDVREMLINIYESRNSVAIKKALRLEQILEQRIAQLPNYLRPQCALILSPDEINNGHNKIRITKGGGFVSLLLEKTEKKRYEKFREKRRLLAEERRQLKEVQDKDVQEWEKNILMKDFEEDIKSMWELPAIGHFIHLCTDIFNIGEVAQFEVERMLLMPQCSDTLDLIMTALLTNSLVRAKLDRTPSMPYSIWAPLVKTRVMSWYRMWHKEGKNKQKLFEEIGIEPEFWLILGPDVNPLDYYYFHEVSLLQRVWILKTLCDVDFVRKKTVYDNIRAQPLDELNPINLGLDQQGNRYIQFKQFSGSDLRIYRQSSKIEGDISPSELIESIEGFEFREGPITSEKVFRDIWELNEKSDIKFKKKKLLKTKHKVKNFNARIKPDTTDKKNLRRSVRAKQKTYVDWSDSDQSDTDLNSLRKKLLKSETETLYRPFSDREFISLSVFRLPRDKVNKPTKRSSYVSRKTEDICRNDLSSADKSIKTEPEDTKEDVKPSGCEDEQSDSLDAQKNMQYIQTDFEKNFQTDDMNVDEFELGEKMDNCELDNNDVKFTVENLETLKMVFKKGSPLDEKKSEENEENFAKIKSEEEKTILNSEYDALYKYNVPNYLKPDSSKFYLVVDSVEGLRQLISKFGSHENDLEIITRSTKSKKKSCAPSPKNTSCEVQLIENLQNLLIDLEPWELDLMKSYRSNKEKMYKEYMNFINRPADFVHPNEGYWMKTYEEPAATTASSTATTITTTTTTADSSGSSGEKVGKESAATVSESSDINQIHGNSLDVLVPRKRTRVTRVQLQPESDEYEDFDDGDDCESNESDDNWVLPTPKKRTKKEAPNRSLKVLKRLSARKAKSSPVEKVDSPGGAGEKTHNSSPERTKKALFWGPRSSDPSEDLNWEKNRQKILEQHNSPVKKALFNTNETEPKTEPESPLHSRVCDNPSAAGFSPKRFTSQIPGNKKVYLTAAQLKALDKDSKQESKQEVISKVSEVSLVENKTPIKVQTYSRVKKDSKPKTISSSTNKTETKSELKPATSEAHVVKLAPKITSGTSLAQPVGQPVTRVQQIQIQDPSGLYSQNKVMSNAKLQPATQWQQKVIVTQPGKIIQQQVQTQAQPQMQVQNQPQNQVQQIVCLEPQKLATLQQPILLPPEKLGNFLHMVNRQAQRGTLNAENELFLTDGKNLIKFDSNFVQQLQKDKMVVDLKKTLLLVKPKLEPKSPDQEQPVVTQQNILVVNKPPPVHQPANSVPNFLIPANYVIKDANQQVQPEQGYQSVKIIQPAPAYVIQQKPPNKAPSTQIIKLISPQPLAPNQNLILSPVAGQVIQPVNQTVMKPEQQTKTLRFIRPHIETSTPNKVNSTQNPIIVNNVVELQGQKLAKSQAPVIAGRVISTAVPTVRMTAPQTVLQPTQESQVRLATSVQTPTQTVVASTVLNPQVVKSSVITQPVRLTAIAQPQVQIPASGVNSTPQFVYSSPVKIATNTQQSPGTQTVRLASSPSLNQVVRPGAPQVKLATSQSPTVMPATFVSAQQIRPTLNAQTIRLVSQPVSSSGTKPVAAQVKIVQSGECQPQTVSSVNTPPTVRLANSQSVRFVQPQPVRLVSANNVGLRFVNKNVTPIKTGVITSASRTPIAAMPSVRPSATVAQPQRLQALLLQSPTARPTQERTEASPAKKTANANTVSNPTVLLLGVDDLGCPGDKVTEAPVTLDYIHGELSVKKTSQGWKYAVKASNGKDIILTDEQIEERLKVNNGVMK